MPNEGNKKIESMPVSEQLFTFPNLTLTLICYQLIFVGLEKG